MVGYVLPLQPRPPLSCPLVKQHTGGRGAGEQRAAAAPKRWAAFRCRGRSTGVYRRDACACHDIRKKRPFAVGLMVELVLTLVPAAVEPAPRAGADCCPSPPATAAPKVQNQTRLGAEGVLEALLALGMAPGLHTTLRLDTPKPLAGAGIDTAGWLRVGCQYCLGSLALALACPDTLGCCGCVWRRSRTGSACALGVLPCTGAALRRAACRQQRAAAWLVHSAGTHPAHRPHDVGVRGG